MVLAATCNIIKELYRLYKRHCSKRLALVTVTTNIINLVITTIFLIDSRVLNPHLIANINSLFNGDATEIVSLLLNHLNIFLLLVVSFALILDSVISVYRAWRYSN